MINLTSRKTRSGNLLALTALTLTLAGCGSGGGGGDIAPVTSTSLATGTFTKSFDPTPDGQNSFPFQGGSDVKQQTLYLASEIGGAGNIKTLRFQRANLAADVTCPNTTVKLGHTNVTALVADFASNVEVGQGSLTPVISDTTLTIPAGAVDTWFDVPLSTSFAYNGVDNLVVEITHLTGCSANAAMRWAAGSSNRRAFSAVTDDVAGTSDLGAAETTASSPVDTTQLTMQFVFAGGDDILDFGGATGNHWPFTDTSVLNNERPRIQNLYLASEINGSGPITGIGFQASTLTTAGTYTYTLKLGHSTLTALTDTFANNYSGAPETVANNVTFSVPTDVAAGEWIWIPIPDGAFAYNGTDNLIVEIETTSGSAQLSLRRATIANRRLAINNSSGTETTGSVTANAYHVAFRFNGATVDRVKSSGSTDGFVFSTNASGRSGQHLYQAFELGTSGTITRLACRMSTLTSTATDYPDFEIAMSHTDATTLGTDPVANMPAPAVVFSGTFSLPAGLKRGDWIEIPLTTGFSYNGKQNLVVQSKTGAGAAAHSCYVASDATRYPARRAAGLTRDAATVSTYDNLRDVRFWINK